MSTIKSSSEDLTLNADGTGRNIKFQSNGVEKASISSAGAFTATTIDATKLTGEKRNYIIDGDFTQWPEGTTSTSVVNGDYVPALWKVYRTGGEIVLDAKQSTDVPTVAESGYQSKYSFHIDVTTAETAVGAGDTAYISHMIDGPNIKALHGQDFVLSFWHKHTKTGTFSGSLRNGAGNRNYTFEYTQSVSDTWEKASIAITGDTTGTWLFTEGSLGMTVALAMMCGSNLALAAGTWTSTTDKVATPNQVAGLDSASNNCKFAQVQLTLGSTAPTFSSPSIATVQDQVAYYVQRYGGTVSNHDICSGMAENGTGAYGLLKFPKVMRATPTMTRFDATCLQAHQGVGVDNATAITFGNISKQGARILVTVSSGLAGDGGVILRTVDSGDWVQADARH